MGDHTEWLRHARFGRCLTPPCSTKPSQAALNTRELGGCTLERGHSHELRCGGAIARHAHSHGDDQKSGHASGLHVVYLG